MFWGLTATFVEVTWEKLVGGSNDKKTTKRKL